MALIMWIQQNTTEREQNTRVLKKQMTLKIETQRQEDNIIFTQITTNHNPQVEKHPSSDDLWEFHSEYFPKPHNVKHTMVKTENAVCESSYKQRFGWLKD